MPTEWKPAHLTMHEVLTRKLRSFLPPEASVLEEHATIKEEHGRRIYQVTTTVWQEGAPAIYRLCGWMLLGTDPLEVEWTALERLE